MSFPETGWQNQGNDHLGTDKVATSFTAWALYNNPIAIAQGADGAPRIKPPALEEAVIVHTYNSSGTFNASQYPGHFWARIRIWAGGGSGGRNNGSNAGAGGGGGGGFMEIVRQISALGSSVSVVVGAGGASRTTNADGLAGGNSTVTLPDGVYGAAGGRGGMQDVTSSVVVRGGIGGGSILRGKESWATPWPDANGIMGGDGVMPASGGTGGGGTGSNASGWPSDSAGNAVWGGAGGGACSRAPGANPSNPGGGSIHGGNGGAGSATGTPGAGQTPGGGGGGSTNAAGSGAGGNGRVTIEISGMPF